jgi:hypothetical protein
MTTQNSDNIEQWDIFEVTLSGPAEGNPFTDVSLSAVLYTMPTWSIMMYGILC